MMTPLGALAATLRAGEWPSPQLLEAVALAGGVSPEEAHDLAGRYQAALPAPDPAAEMLAVLRSFRLDALH